MTFLEILKKMCRRVGYAEPSATSSLDDGQQLLWDHVVDAYNDIQLSCANWDFLQSTETIQLLSGKREYTTIELNMPYVRDFSDGKILDQSTSKTKYNVILKDHVTIEDYIAGYGEATAWPYMFTFYKNKLSFCSAPPEQCKFQVQISRSPFTDVTGSPVWDEEFHQIVFHAAMMDYTVDDNDPELYQRSSAKYAELHNRMLLHHSPELHFAIQ